MIFSEKNIFQKESITVDFFYTNLKEIFGLRIYSKEGLGFDNLIKEKTLHRPQFGLVGFMDLFNSKRVQVFGNTEMRYLNQLSSKKKV